MDLISCSQSAAVRLSDRKLCNNKFTQFSDGLPRANISRTCLVNRNIFLHNMKDISVAGQQQCASVKLRRKKEETKSSRRSVDYRKRSEKCDSNDNLDTLDHVTDIIEMKNNLRQALRSKYKVEDCVQIKHFGYIDQPAEVNNLQYFFISSKNFSVIVGNHQETIQIV